MEPADFMMAALVGIVCGTAAQLTSGYSRGGWIVNMGVAFVGAILGASVARLLNAPSIYDFRYRMVDFPIVYSIIGSALFVGVLGFLIKPNNR